VILEPDMPPRRRRGSFNVLPAFLLIVIVLPLLASAGVYLFVDPNGFKPRIAAAMLAATGREIALRGPITLRLGLEPRLRADDVGLANIPGGTRADMITVKRIEARLSLWPLLRGRAEGIRLVLIEPDVLLEANAAGMGNWQMGASLAASTSPAGPAAAQGPVVEPPPRVTIAELRIESGRVTWRGATAPLAIDIASLSANAAGPGQPISASGELRVAGHAVSVSAELGSASRLLAASAAQPWPAQIVARFGGARLAVSGTVADPLRGRGYRLGLEGSLTDLAPVGESLGVALPSVHDVTLAARLEEESGQAVVSAVSLRGGAADLGSVRPGLAIDRVEILVPALDQPARVALDGALGGPQGTPLRLSGEIGPMTGLFGPEPFPIDLAAAFAGARLSTKGTLARPLAGAGFDGQVVLQIDDVASLGHALGQSWPGLKDAAVTAHVSDIAAGMTVRDLQVTSPQGDLAGDLAVVVRPGLAVAGQLAGKRLDLDALQAVLASSPPPQAAPLPEPGSPAHPAAPRLIPDEPLRLSRLDVGDLDLRLSLGEIRSGGIVYRDLAAHGVLASGRMTLDPVSAMLPGGRLEGRMSISLRESQAPVAVALHAPGLALKPLLNALGLPEDVTGTVEIEADLTGTGRTLHDLARGATGRLGLVMQDGELDNRLLGGLLGGVARVARLPPELLGVPGILGRTRLRCIALRADLAQGAATIPALVVEGGRFLVTGSGTASLEDETLALRLRPMLRTGGPGLVIPVRVAGSFLAPGVTLEGGGTVGGLAAGLGAGLAGLARPPAQAVPGLLAGERGGDSCTPVINLARAARPK
jgi:AsmA protein